MCSRSWSESRKLRDLVGNSPFILTRAAFCTPVCTSKVPRNVVGTRYDGAAMGCLERSRANLAEAIERVEQARADLLHVVGTRPLRAALGASKEVLEGLREDVDQIADQRLEFEDARYHLTAAGEALLDAIRQREVS